MAGATVRHPWSRSRCRRAATACMRSRRRAPRAMSGSRSNLERSRLPAASSGKLACMLRGPLLALLLIEGVAWSDDPLAQARKAVAESDYVAARPALAAALDAG